MEGNSRKAGIIILGIGVLGLLIALGSGCGPRSPFEGGDHSWSSRRGPHGFHKGDYERMLKHVDERVQTLNLTEPQKEQYAAIRLKLKSVLIGGRENRKRLMTSVREEMKKDMPDIHEVAGTISDHVGMLLAAVDKGLNLFLEFYEILDENQKAKVVQHFRDHLNRIFFKDVAETGGSSLQEDGGMTSGSLSDQMAQKRGDRHGELL
ncbi:MAG: Spy/CpxP family protein refolding chaperone [Desulfobacterales bacterium]|nr:Spy/CpxP family protein refolding chaperone [Desulfobacterales bacterium]